MKWIPIHFINNQIIKGVRPVIRDVMNVIFLVKVMLFVRISIETPPSHHIYIHNEILAHHIFCIVYARNIYMIQMKYYFLWWKQAQPWMKSRQIKKEKKKKKRKIWENDKNFYFIQRYTYHHRNGRWNVVQMEGVCYIL